MWRDWIHWTNFPYAVRAIERIPLYPLQYASMRLIAWNANYNARRRTLEETAALLAPLHADTHRTSVVPGGDLDEFDYSCSAS